MPVVKTSIAVENQGWKRWLWYTRPPSQYEGPTEAGL